MKGMTTALILWFAPLWSLRNALKTLRTSGDIQKQPNVGDFNSFFFVEVFKVA